MNSAALLAFKTRHGLSWKQLAGVTLIPPSTLRAYAARDAAYGLPIPPHVGALFALLDKLLADRYPLARLAAYTDGDLARLVSFLGTAPDRRQRLLGRIPEAT